MTYLLTITNLNEYLTYHGENREVRDSLLIMYSVP